MIKMRDARDSSDFIASPMTWGEIHQGFVDHYASIQLLMRSGVPTREKGPASPRFSGCFSPLRRVRPYRCRIHHESSCILSRSEVPDPLANPYLGFGRRRGPPRRRGRGRHKPPETDWAKLETDRARPGGFKSLSPRLAHDFEAAAVVDSEIRVGIVRN